MKQSDVQSRLFYVLRKQKGWNLESLSKDLGIPKSTLSSIENRKSAFSDSQFQSAAKLFNITWTENGNQNLENVFNAIYSDYFFMQNEQAKQKIISVLQSCSFTVCSPAYFWCAAILYFGFYLYLDVGKIFPFIKGNEDSVIEKLEDILLHSIDLFPESVQLALYDLISFQRWKTGRMALWKKVRAKAQKAAAGIEVSEAGGMLAYHEMQYAIRSRSLLEGLRQYQKTKDIFTRFENYPSLSCINMQYGNFLTQMGKFNEARDVFLLSLKNADRPGCYSLKPLILENMIWNSLMAADYLEANDLFERLEQLAPYTKPQRLKNRIYWPYSLYLVSREQNSLPLRNKAVEVLNRNLSVTNDYCDQLICQVLSYLIREHFISFFKAIEKAIRELEKLDKQDDILFLMKMKENVYYEQKNWELLSQVREEIIAKLEQS